MFKHISQPYDESLDTLNAQIGKFDRLAPARVVDQFPQSNKFSSFPYKMTKIKLPHVEREDQIRNFLSDVKRRLDIQLLLTY
ncbi:hypothetical protein DPMN_156548 [Dreissena polymorpha]|uniref:Uncharacterized protein n=1 Tax=Dreissena polymorpha TaxID=45954 RepID=A0A9D4FP72_DREPO|nr:hypothetical protein DPMN_156548 [Dreissena polymorpha]